MYEVCEQRRRSPLLRAPKERVQRLRQAPTVASVVIAVVMDIDEWRTEGVAVHGRGRLETQQPVRGVYQLGCGTLILAREEVPGVVHDVGSRQVHHTHHPSGAVAASAAAVAAAHIRVRGAAVRSCGHSEVSSRDTVCCCCYVLAPLRPRDGAQEAELAPCKQGSCACPAERHAREPGWSTEPAGASVGMMCVDHRDIPRR
jgi:hypothetical protein